MRLLPIAVLVLLLGCSSSTPPEDTEITEVSTRKITLFNGVKMELYEGESEVSLEQADKDLYASLTSVSQIQVPLFKKVKGDGYSIFVGLPVGMDFSKSDELRVINTDFQELEEKSDQGEDFSYRQYENASKMGVVEHIVERKKSKFYLLYYSDSSVLEGVNFNLETCQDRIK